MHAQSLTGEFGGQKITQILPDVPEHCARHVLLFSGSVRRFLKDRLISVNSKNQHLFWSLSQVKRAAEVVPESFVAKALLKHRRAMETPSGPSTPSYLASMSAKLTKIFRGVKPKRTVDVREYSTTACWESSRDGGGAKGYLLYDHVQQGLTSNDEMLRMSYDPVKGVMEDRGFATVDVVDLIEGEERRVSTCLANGEDIRCQAKVSPVCEPLKVRTITAGNAHAYAAAMHLQKAMHSHLKSSHQFQLIGESVTRLHAIQWITEQSQRGVWCSGDYSGATDLIKIELTKMAFEIVLKECDFGERYNIVLRRVLYEHVISYPKGSGPDGSDIAPVVQENGQLMGSVLSFPILCAVNLAHYWHTVEPEVTNFRQLKALVNGDDILFRTTPDKYRTWYDNLHEAGFVPSPGKNFFHPKFFTINSQLFSAGQGVSIPTRIPFFNTGLLYGQSKVGAREDELAKPVYMLHNPCVDGALNKKRASQRFLAINRWELHEVSQHQGVQMNYFIAPELGGLGLNPPPGSSISMNPNHKKPSDINVTSMQLRLASYLHVKWLSEYTTPPAGPIGMPKRTNDLSMLSLIEDHKEYDASEERIQHPFHPYHATMRELEEEYADLFVSGYGLSPLGVSSNTRKRYPPVEKRIVRRLVETNAFIIPGVRPVLPEVGGPTNSGLNELSDKDMLRLSYTWRMPVWKKVLAHQPMISASSSCRKKYLEVTSSISDLCIPEHFCY
jgi:hypothetical protein